MIFTPEEKTLLTHALSEYAWQRQLDGGIFYAPSSDVAIEQKKIATLIERIRL